MHPNRTNSRRGSSRLHSPAEPPPVRFPPRPHADLHAPTPPTRLQASCSPSLSPRMPARSPPLPRTHKHTLPSLQTCKPEPPSYPLPQACTAEGNDRIAKLGPNVLGPLHPCAVDVINTMRDVSGLDEVREKSKSRTESPPDLSLPAPHTPRHSPRVGEVRE
jgi:hypothetical protein